MRSVVMVWLLTLAAWAVPILSPFKQLNVDGIAKDLVVKDGIVLIATDKGHVEIFDQTSLQKVEQLNIPDVKDFMGDTVPARVLSSDECEGRYVILSDSGIGGYSDLYLFEAGTVTKLLTADDKKALIKVRFVDKDHILLGYLSNEAALMDLRTGKERYRVQLSESKFSDFALNEDKTQAVFSCESGVLSVIDVQTGKILKTLEGLNVDNVYRVDFKKRTVSAAGQDRRGAIYDVETGKGYYIQGHFLIYATALSPSAKTVAFAMDEDNTITVFNTLTKAKKAYLKGQKSTLNVMVFTDEKTLYSASDDNTVMVWKLP